MKVLGDGAHARMVWEAAAGIWRDGLFFAVGDNKARKGWVALHPDEPSPVIIHPSAWVSQEALIGDGTVIMPGAVVRGSAKIGKHVIVNSGAVVEHDCVLEDFVHIAPGAHLCGNVHVGEGTLVGVGVGIAPNTTIPPWSLVKARRLEIEPL